MAGEGYSKQDWLRALVMAGSVWLGLWALYLAGYQKLVIQLALAAVVLIPIVLLGQKVALWLVRW